MEMKNLFQRNLRDMEGRYKTDFYVFFFFQKRESNDSRQIT